MDVSGTRLSHPALVQRQREQEQKKVHKVSLDAACEPEAQTEILHSFSLVRGVGAGQAGHFAAQPKSSLNVQRAAVPRLVHSKAGFMHRHVCDAGMYRAASGQRLMNFTH